MLRWLVLISGFTHISLSLNPLDCNGIVYTSQGQINAEPAGVCKGDTYSWVNYNLPNFSVRYDCNGNSVYQKQWNSSSTCSGDPFITRKMSDVIQADTTNYGSEFFETCDATDCEYAKQITYYPFDTSSAISSSKESCEAWTPTTTDSGYIEFNYIRGYCYDYNHPPSNLSAKWSCPVASEGVAVIYESYHDVSDCSGTAQLSFSAYLTNDCFAYSDHYKRERYECDGVPTPSPTPQWTPPVTELPCNAVEFEYDGTAVSYPVDVCIHDKISSRSLQFYCDGDTLKFHQWDASTSCDGTATFNGESFQDYIDEQDVLVKALMGSYSAECGKSECEYVVMKEYTYSGDCDAFTATESTPYTETYFIRDYCLAMNDGINVGSLSWGCDVENGHATWISWTDVTDCSDLSKASLSWVDIGTDQCLATTLATNYVDVTCYITPEPTAAPSPPPTEPTKAPTNTDKAHRVSLQGVVWIIVCSFFIKF